MLTVLIAANTHTQNRLGQVVANVQPELTPNLIFNVVCRAKMQACLREQLFDCLDALTVKRRLQLAEHDALGGHRVKAVALPLQAGRDLDQRGQHMLGTHSTADYLLAIHAVHEAHHRCVWPRDLANRLKRPLERAVLEADDEQIDIVRRLWRQDLRTIALPVDDDAVFFEAFGTAALGNERELNLLAARQPPYHVGANGPCSQYGDVRDLHSCSLCLLGFPNDDKARLCPIRRRAGSKWRVAPVAASQNPEASSPTCSYDRP